MPSGRNVHRQDRQDIPFNAKDAPSMHLAGHVVEVLFESSATLDSINSNSELQHSADEHNDDRQGIVGIGFLSS